MMGSLTMTCHGGRQVIARQVPTNRKENARSEANLSAADACELHLQRCDPVLQQPSPGITGLLGMKLRGPQRAVLESGDESVVDVVGPGHFGCIDRGMRVQNPVAYPVGVHEVEALTL